MIYFGRGKRDGAAKGTLEEAAAAAAVLKDPPGNWGGVNRNPHHHLLRAERGISPLFGSAVFLLPNLAMSSSSSSSPSTPASFLPLPSALKVPILLGVGNTGGAVGYLRPGRRRMASGLASATGGEWKRKRGALSLPRELPEGVALNGGEEHRQAQAWPRPVPSCSSCPARPACCRTD